MARNHRCIFNRHFLVIISILLLSGIYIPLSPISNIGVKLAFAAPDDLSGTKSICFSRNDGGTMAYNGENSSLEDTDVSDSSPFALADPDRNPTVVTLKDFSMVDTPFAALGIVLAFLLLLCAWMAFRQVFQ